MVTDVARQTVHRKVLSRKTRLSQLVDTKDSFCWLGRATIRKVIVGRYRAVRCDVSDGFDCAPKTRRPDQLAARATGRPDGYSQNLGNRYGTVNGSRSVPVLGGECTGFIRADISGIQGVVTDGNEVLIQGAGNRRIEVKEVASLSEAIVDEIGIRLSTVKPRVAE